MNDGKERKSLMAQLLQSNPNLAPDGVMALGYQLHDFLRDAIADPGTGVDTGCGMGSFDLWVKVDGVEYFVNVKRAGVEA